jgi:hypothetical protein
MAARLRHRADRADPAGPLTPRQLAIGLVSVAVYLTLALVSMGAFGWAVRPLFDGFTTSQPYNWVRPPAEFAARNKPPEPGSLDVILDKSGSLPAQATTGDAQARLVMPAGVFAPREGDVLVRVEVTPLDAATVAPPPPGRAFQGNAYRFEATFQPSGMPAVPVKEANLLLRYPASATGLGRFMGARWVVIPAQDIAASLQLLANTKELGVFVAVGPTLHRQGRSFLLIVLSGGAAILALALGLYLRSRAARRKRAARTKGVRGSPGDRAKSTNLPRARKGGRKGGPPRRR